MNSGASEELGVNYFGKVYNKTKIYYINNI
jgi:hypothetical protein